MSEQIAGLSAYERIFRAPKLLRRGLDRDSLPAPRQYLAQRNLLKAEPRGKWAAISCPAHKAGAEANPSLRVCLADGHFKCMACGVAGGDLIALHRLITGASFREAVRELGGRFHD